MDIVFERGNRDKPKGHAILYFRSLAEANEIWGTYLVILPITVDVAKYVPPFLMNQVGEMGPKDLAAFAFPPVPEKVEGHKYLERLASVRDDDILFGGDIRLGDMQAAMMAVNEVVGRYAEIYSQLVSSCGLQEESADTEVGGVQVREVLYDLMSDNDRLSELTRLVGRLRFAVEGAEVAMIKETEEDICLLAEHMPENHQISQLIEVAKARGSEDARLTDLYLQRCFHLIQEEYVKLGQVEDEIRGLRS